MSSPLTVGEALNRARELMRCGKLADAAQSCVNLLAAIPDLAPALHLLALVTYQQGKPDKAVDLLRRAIRSSPRSPEAYNDLGSMWAQMGNHQEAVRAYQEALRLAPEFPEAHNNLGNLLQMRGALEDSAESYRKALHLRPDYAEAHRNLASALRKLGRLDEAVGALEIAVSLNPAYAEALALLVHQLKEVCDWRRIDQLTARLIELVDSGSGLVNPFVFLSLETTASQQLQCAVQWAAAHLRAQSKPARSEKSGRITIGYLSADFQEHATAHLISELFVLHDRSRFRIIGYSYGRDDGSGTRQRLAGSLDAFVDLETLSHADAAARIRQDGVDILVDLKGYTADARPEILALRPAPIQVSYLGYPGTMGTQAIDYILVDPFVVPPDQQPYFTEKLIPLPDCYQINNCRRPIAPHIPSREECNLPESGVVFCCLSACYKIMPRMFDIWMRLLAAVPGSVLWLLESNASATANLRREADARLNGGASRLVFAPSLPNPEHLARLGIADLFLDTLPYNAHTLASDALWAGCPVVTCAGATFASRVAGSILHALGLPDLVTATVTEYEALALRLARDRGLLEAMRAKVQSNRTTMPLFDSDRTTRQIEAAVERMCGGS